MADDTQQIDYDALSKDKDFLALRSDQQRAYLSAVDKDFAGLDPESQKGYIAHLTGVNPEFSRGLLTASPASVSDVHPGSVYGTNQPLTTQRGLQLAAQDERTQEYMRESGEMIGSTAGAMATGGLSKGPGILRLLGRASATGAGTGVGTAAGGGTPSEAAGAAVTGAVTQPVAEGLTAGALKLLGPKNPGTLSVWESIWNRLTGKAGYAQDLKAYAGDVEAAKNANLARYRLTEQNAQSAIDEANANVAKVRANLPAGEAGQWADLNTTVGATPRSIRIGKGASDLGMTYGNAGRGLLREGLDAPTLSKLTPPEQAALIGPKWQAAGKAVQDAADKATEAGMTLDAGASVTKVIKNRIADPSLQEKAIELINSHQHDLGIENMREATPQQALALRQALRNDANFGPNSTTDSMKGIGKAFYSAVSSDLHDAIPTMKAVDQHYGDMAEAVSAVQRQTQRYAAGQWKPPLTQVEKAQAQVPTMPNVSPYTPLPAPPTAPSTLNQFLTAGKNLAPWILGGGGLYGLERWRAAQPR